MNKEVIYLEPEDDITDILTKLQKAEQKLVALVPPQKATILRSAVNMKLIARAAKESEKVAVVVTADPAVVKLAMAAEIPVAKTLQSRPVIPTPETIAKASQPAEVLEDGADDDSESVKPAKNPEIASEASERPAEARSAKKADTIELDDEAPENASEELGKHNQDKKASEKTKKVPSFDKYRKWVIIGVTGGLALIAFLVWAFVFAPAADITVAVSTTSVNFSETITFTSDLNNENAAEGRFYAEKQVLEQKYSTKVAATGEENRGEKASGEVTLSLTFYGSQHPEGFVAGVAKGDQLSHNGLIFTAQNAAALSWDGNYPITCADGSTVSNGTTPCVLRATVAVIANAPGEQYNVPAGTIWDSVGSATVSNSAAFTGGTTDNIKVVSQVDVDKAKEDLINGHSTAGQNELLSEVKQKSVIILESSAASEPGTPVANPAVGAEATETTVELAIVYSVYTIDFAKVEEFIKAKAGLPTDQKIYSIGQPYLERFTSLEESARLKTVYKSGPTITEESILEKAQGRKIGEVKSILQSINGVSSVEITPSFFWVRSVPTDVNKITIDLTVEDNN